MAVSKERNSVAKLLDEAINPIAEDIFREWGLSFEEIQKKGLEPKFDRELIKRINENDEARCYFCRYMTFASDNYGKIWSEFSKEQQDIIVLKESKIFW